MTRISIFRKTRNPDPEESRSCLNLCFSNPESAKILSFPINKMPSLSIRNVTTDGAVSIFRFSLSIFRFSLSISLRTVRRRAVSTNCSWRNGFGPAMGSKPTIRRNRSQSSTKAEEARSGIGIEATPACVPPSISAHSCDGRHKQRSNHPMARRSAIGGICT